MPSGMLSAAMSRLRTTMPSERGRGARSRLITDVMTVARHPSANPARPAVFCRDTSVCGDDGSIPLFTGGTMHPGGARDKANEVHEIEIHSLGEFIDRVTPLEPDPKTGRR